MAALLRRFISTKTIAGFCRPRPKYPNHLCGSGSWMSTMSSPSPPPWLMLPPTVKGREMVYNFYSLSDSKVVSFNGKQKEVVNLDDETKTTLVGSSHGWLALFNLSNCNLFLTNPLSGRHIQLPSIHTLPIPEENLSDGSGCVGKVIISTSPDGQDCRAMMTYGPTERLAFCRPGLCTEWTPIGAPFYDGPDRIPRPYDDFVYSARDEAFFCVTVDGDLEAWDVGDPQSPEMIMFCPVVDDFRSREKSLLKQMCMWQNYPVVGDGGEILLVRRYIFSTDLLLGTGLLRSDGSYDDGIFRWDGSFDQDSLEEALRRSVNGDVVQQDFDLDKCIHKTIGFDVYKFDRKEGRLRYVENSLDGLALFVGLNHSAAREFPQLKPNSIYFTDRFYNISHDIGVFNYEDSTISSCYYPSAVRSITDISPLPLWFIPHL